MSFNRLNSTFIYFHDSCTFHVYIYNTFHVSTLRGKMLIAYEVVHSCTVVLQSQDHCLFVPIHWRYPQDSHLSILFNFSITFWIYNYSLNFNLCNSQYFQLYAVVIKLNETSSCIGPLSQRTRKENERSNGTKVAGKFLLSGHLDRV